MKFLKTLKTAFLHWKSIALIAALGSAGFGGVSIYGMFKEMDEYKDDWTFWAALVCICLFVLLNIFSAVNVFFLDKLVVHILLMITYGVDAALSAFILAILSYDMTQNRDDYTTKSYIFYGLLGVVFLLGVFSAFQLTWRLEKTEKGRS